MKLNEEELGKLVETKIKPYLKVERPEDKVDNGDEKGKGIFKSFGEYLQSAVRKDEKWSEYCEKVLSMDSDTAGGYLVPEEFIPEIQKVASEDGIVRPLATVLPAGAEHPDAEVNIPVLDQAGSTGKAMFAGVDYCWTDEAGSKVDTEPKLDSVKLAPYEYSASTVITDKLLRNANIVEALVKATYSRAQVAFEDYYFLRGTGIGQPLGVLNSPAYLTMARAGLGAIAYADVLDLRTQLIPGANPVWVISQSAYADIVTLADGAGHSIFIGGDITKSVPDRLLGFPIKWTYRVPAVGTVGDISLCDFSYYLIKDGFGPAFDTSKHVYFQTNKTMLKMFANVDGQPWLTDTILAEDEATEISPFLGLTTLSST